jgi:hypothetical protein
VEYDDTNTTTITTLDASGKMGGLVRGGFEWGKFRMGFEYNIVRDSSLQNMSGANIGTVSNSYLGIHLGFFLVEENGGISVPYLIFYYNHAISVVFLCPKISLLCRYELEYLHH